MANQKYDQYGNPIPADQTSQTDPNSGNYGQLPAIQPNDPNATVSLTKDAQNMGNSTNVAATPAATTQGNTAVLAQAQTNVLNQPNPANSPLQTSITNQAQNFVNNPMGDYDPQKTKQAAMENADTNWAKAFEGQRQQFGNTSGSGLLQQNMLNNALQHNVDMNSLGSQLDNDNYNRYIDAMTKSLASGSNVSQQNANMFSQGLSNLNTVRGMAEGERSQTSGFAYDASKTATENAQQLLMQSNDQTGAQALATLQGKIQSGQQLQAQDFQATQNAIDNALKTAMQTNDIQAQKDITALKGQIDAQAQAAQQKYESGENALNRAQQLTVLGKDQEGQQALAELQGKIQQGLLITGDDFKAAQSALDRAQQTALQTNDIQAQKDITTLKGQIDSQAQAAQNQFADAQRVATQTWQTGQTISQQQFTAGQQYLQQQFESAQKDKDIDAQKYIQSQQASLQLKMQTQDMDQQTKMAYLNNQLSDAKANNDVKRQEEILNFQHTQELDTLKETQGFQAAMQKAQLDSAAALKAGDWASAANIQKTQISYQIGKDAQDLSIALAQQALQGKQITLQGQQMTFDQIEEGIKNGQIDPKAGTDAIAAAAKAIGINVQAADPDATQKSAIKQYNDMQVTYGLSHPDQVQAVDANGKAVTIKTSADLQALLNNDGRITGLTNQGNTEFNDYVNKTTNTTTDTATIVAKTITDPANMQGSADANAANHADYVALKSKSTSFRYNPSKLDSGTYKFATSIPGINTAFTQANGTLCIATSGTQVEKRDWAPDKQYFTAIDVNTGHTIKIYAGA